jgi:hypothetical protein
VKRRLTIAGAAGGAILLAASGVLAQQEEVKIVTPQVDKAKGLVTLPGAFWNTREADWVEVALSGRPSDFLHETVVSVTTTRTLLEQSMRAIGCRDGDAWADGVKDFARLRGDRFLVLLDVTRDGKVETYSLDELLEFHGWGVALGPYGFMFRGDPERAVPGGRGAASLPADAPDSLRIMRNDPQIALIFKGLQSMTQTFADHPLAYVEDGWLWEELNRDRNKSVLPADVFNSNGKVPVTLRFMRVSDEALLTESAKVWHDRAFTEVILKQVETARRIDKNKAEYWGLRADMEKLAATKPELRDAEKEVTVLGRAAMLLAAIGRDYAALDAAWTEWSADHLKPATQEEKAVAMYRTQAARWREYMNLAKEEALQVALAEEAAQERKMLVLKAQPGLDAKVAVLRGKEMEARSRATIAASRQAGDYWQDQFARLDDPKSMDIWGKNVRAQRDLALARRAAGEAGVAFGQAQQTLPAEDAKVKELRAASLLAGLKMMRAEASLNLLSVEFDISKREGIGGNDPELPNMRKAREALVQKMKELDEAIGAK